MKRIIFLFAVIILFSAEARAEDWQFFRADQSVNGRNWYYDKDSIRREGGLIIFTSRGVYNIPVDDMVEGKMTNFIEGVTAVDCASGTYKLLSMRAYTVTKELIIEKFFDSELREPEPGSFLSYFIPIFCSQSS